MAKSPVSYAGVLRSSRSPATRNTEMKENTLELKNRIIELQAKIQELERKKSIDDLRLITASYFSAGIDARFNAEFNKKMIETRPESESKEEFLLRYQRIHDETLAKYDAEYRFAGIEKATVRERLQAAIQFVDRHTPTKRRYDPITTIRDVIEMEEKKVTFGHDETWDVAKNP